MKNARALRGNAMLILTAFIWGVAFLAQQSGGAAMGSLTFNGVRSFLGGALLLVLLPLLDRVGVSRKPSDRAEVKTTLVGGVLCGTALCAATNVQQVALEYTTIGKAGFITSLYIVLVPLLGLLVGRRTTLMNWLGVAVAAAGLYLLCDLSGGEGFAVGDLLLLLSALLFAVQILLVSYFSTRADCIRLSCVQFFTVGVITLPLMFVFEQPSLPVMAENWLSLLYAGLLSSGVAYTLQVLAQRDTDPTAASVLMSLESVFAALAGWAVLGDRMTPTELLGCALMFGAVLLAQLPMPRRKKEAVS